MHFTRVLLVVAICSLVPVFSARAEPPAGVFALTIGGPDSLAARMRLLEGEHAPDPACVDRGTYDICTSSEVHTDAAGDVSGALTFTYTGTTQGVVDFLIDGTVKASPGVAKSKLLFTPQGTLDVDGVEAVASGKGKGFCRDDIDEGLTFNCDSKIRFCLIDQIISDCDRFFAFYSFAEQRAAWDLDLELATDERGAITGSGFATLANGVEIEFTAKGKYSATKDVANVTLTGLGIANKSKITIKQLRVDEGDLIDGRVKFKVAGQSGVYEIPLPSS